MGKDYDPRMHSAEHILNGTMVKLFKRGRSFSNHIEKKKSKCDYHFDRDLTDEEISEIEKRVNWVIAEDMSVQESYISRTEANERFNLMRLPADAGDDIRIISIGEYDACPCSGNHVISTGEIGGFRIISTSYNDGILRIRYKLADTPL
jgi:alanyl-tRNA synthetase